MTDWPEAVRTYEEMKAELDPGHWNALAAYTDAAIAALKERWLECERRFDLTIEKCEKMIARAEQAEAEVERLKWMLRDVLENYVIDEYGGDVEGRIAESEERYRRRDIDVADAAIEALKAEVERLRWMLDTCIADNHIEYQEIRDAAKRDLAARYDRREKT